MFERLPAALGGTAGGAAVAPPPVPAPVPPPAAGGRPRFCLRETGAVCCFKRDKQYNT